jgi:SAM-dependent methyltransferase
MAMRPIRPFRWYNSPVDLALKKELIELALCPVCAAPLGQPHVESWTCAQCGYDLPFYQGIPLFTSPPGELVPFDKRERGPQLGSTWRQANWQFLHAQSARMPADGIVLDVGAGRGDFTSLFQDSAYLALDVYPYPEVDLVCDLTRLIPFRAGSFARILLMNVLEHVYDAAGLLSALAGLLKPGGELIVAVPFLLKVHQAPVDFYRYTHFALRRLGEEAGLETKILEGFYDPAALVGEGTRNVRYTVMQRLPRVKRVLTRLVLDAIDGLNAGLLGLVGSGFTSPPEAETSPAPLGYHIIFRKPA